MNAKQALRLVTASFVALACLGACAEDDALRSVDDQVELAVDTVEGQFPNFTIDREALARAIEAAELGTYAPPPIGPCPPAPNGPQSIAPSGAAAAAQTHALELDHGGPRPLDPVTANIRDDGEQWGIVEQLELDEREQDGREPERTVFEPLGLDEGKTGRDPAMTVFEPLGIDEGDDGRELHALGLVVALPGANTIEAPDVDQCLELCVSDYAGCAGTEANQLICADQISACVEGCL